MEAATRKKTDLGSLPKGLRILESIARFEDGARFVDISNDTSLPVSTTHRLLATLVSHGFVDYNSKSRLYSVGLKVFELSRKVVNVNRVTEIAIPIMDRLAFETGCVVLLNILDGGETLVLERSEPPVSVQVRTAIGSRLPLHATASGKVIIAFLEADEQRELTENLELQRVTERTITNVKDFKAELDLAYHNGYAVSDEEHEVGIRALAKRFADRRNSRQFALALAAPTFSMTVKELIGFLAPLSKAIGEIEARAVD